ncbi:MAG: hypothetical protein ACUVRJ_07500 [Candidatus Villigracilaceae bacterium]
MTKKEQPRTYDFDLLALPPLKMVLGEVPVPDPKRQAGQPIRPTGLSMNDKQDIVRRIIKRLKAR